MNWILSVVVAASCVLALVAQAPDENSLAARRARLKEALQAEWEHQLRASPELATSVGDHRYNDRLSDYSPEFVAAEVQHAQDALRIFESIDTTGFPEQEHLSAILMIRELREQIEGVKFNDWEMPVDQMNGIQVQLASLPGDTVFRTAKDYQDYIARLHQVPRALQQVTGEHADRYARSPHATALFARQSGRPGAEDRRQGSGPEPLRAARAEFPRRCLRSREKVQQYVRLNE